MQRQKIGLNNYICDMKFHFSIVFFLFTGYFIFGQNTVPDSTSIDYKYREDQFYISVTYNLLGNKIANISQNGFSSGIHFGFLRDMPINERRNIAIGLGFGLSSNSYNQNMLISKGSDQSYNYSILDKNETPFRKNKFSTYLIDIPFEFRWRTSTPTEYNFLRIYSGFKFSYLMYNTSKFKSSEGDIILSNIDDFNKIQYGITLSAGYSNINVHFYYALNDIFKEKAKINGEHIAMNAIKIGLIYYIL